MTSFPELGVFIEHSLLFVNGTKDPVLVFSACVRKFARRSHALARSFVAPFSTPPFFATNTLNRRNGLEKQFQEQLAAHSESVGRTAGADQTRSRDCPVIGRGGQRHRLSLAALSLPLSTQKTENVWTPRSFIRAGWRVIVHTSTLSHYSVVRPGLPGPGSPEPLSGGITASGTGRIGLTGGDGFLAE